LTAFVVRIACLFVPLFPLAARIRSEPGLAREAVVLVTGNGNAARVVAATRKARQAGIAPGLTLPQARALLPNLLARGRDAESESAAREALLDVAGAFSPRVEDAGEGVVHADVEGLGRRFPGERDLGEALLAAAKKESLPARCGIAGSKLAARVAASLPESPTVVAPGGEAAFLAPLPLARLDPEIAIAETLSRWGLRTIGDLAKLPPADVASRLGEAGLALHKTARGRDPRPLVPTVPPPAFSEGMELEWPLVTLEPFLALAEGALERLVRRLTAQALGCARLGIDLKLEPDGHDVRDLPLPAPTREVKTLLTLTRLDLEARAPGAPVNAFTFTAHPDRPRQGQLTLFGPAEVSPDRLATALAKLFALLGEGRLGTPQTVSGHRPERFALVPYAPPPAPTFKLAPRSGRGLLAVRVLRPALPLDVITDATGPGAPAEALRLLFVKSVPNANGNGHGGPPPPDVSGAVRVASGPWGLEEAWWTEAPLERAYWDVELSGGGLYRIFRDEKTGDWFADGVYD
jgi:protein ImuB